MLKLINLFFIIISIIKGFNAGHAPDIVEDGMSRSKVSNIKRTHQYIRWSFEDTPGKNILLTSFAQDYGIGFVAIFAKNKNVSDNLLNIINYESKEQIITTLPSITSEVVSFGSLTSVWSGSFYADCSRMFKRSLIDRCLTTFYSNTITSDFGNPNLAANAINLSGIYRTRGFSENGEYISPDELGVDGRLMIITSHYFKGTFDNTCETIYTNFTLICGNTIQLPTLHIQGSHGYAKRDDLNAEIIEILFKGGNFKLRLVRPQSTKDMLNILNKFNDAECYEEVFSNLIETELDIFMPEFDIHQTFDFIEYFEQLQELNNTKIADIELDGVYENANDAYFTKVKLNLRLIINRDCSQGNLEDSCTQQNHKSQQIDLNTPFIYYVMTKSNHIMTAGIFSGGRKM